MTKDTHKAPTCAELRTAILALTEDKTEAELKKLKQADLVALLEAAQGKHKAMGATLNRYRAGYEDTASYSGRLSKHNGDNVAAALAGAAPEAVIAAAELLLELEAGSLAAKYAHLNPGQRRMNAGNRIRAAVKRGDLDAEAVTKAMH